MQVADYGSLPPRRGLGLEIEALRRLERAERRTALRPDARGRGWVSREAGIVRANGGERLLVWESDRPAVILPRHADPAAWADLPACAARGVPLLYRESGGGAVVVGPGCLNFALVLSLAERPGLLDIEFSYACILGRVAGVLALDGVATRSTDLALCERKFAGHAQRRVRGALLHHGVLLYDFDDFDLDLVDALLREPVRRPAWRGNRTHREFLTRAPLARNAIVRRLRLLPAALEESAAGVSAAHVRPARYECRNNSFQGTR